MDFFNFFTKNAIKTVVLKHFCLEYQFPYNLKTYKRRKNTKYTLQVTSLHSRFLETRVLRTTIDNTDQIKCQDIVWIGCKYGNNSGIIIISSALDDHQIIEKTSIKTLIICMNRITSFDKWKNVTADSFTIRLGTHSNLHDTSIKICFNFRRHYSINGM